MKIIIKVQSIKEILQSISEDDQKIITDQCRLQWAKDEEKLKLDISKLSDPALKVVHDNLDSHSSENNSIRMSRNQVKQWMEIKTNPDGARINKLENVPAIIKTYMEHVAPNRYVFIHSEDGNFVPYFMKNVEYNSGSRSDGDPYVRINLDNIDWSGDKDNNRTFDKKCIMISSENISGGITVTDLLHSKNVYVETKEHMETYQKELERFNQYRNKIGFQMNVCGKACGKSNWYYSSFQFVERNGSPAKMVVDSANITKENFRTTTKFWSEDDEESEEKSWELPIIPYIRMFDLTEHINYAVHINNMTEYQYDNNVGKKLVLPEDVKELLEILVEHANSEFSDIISGKAGGAIILCQGAPGTGKTLTSEVYSEIMKRPLYKVQSSQLGVDIDELEKKLQKVLERAERWGAILLLDEADVYVRSRGNEIEQNAIVGVFLRVLEYYRGVLFMTTNRGTEIDDAIVSRLTARITYQIPNEDDRKKIWNIIAEQNGIKISNDDLDVLVDKIPDISGRDIKNLLKLAKLVTDKKNLPVTADIILGLLKFKCNI